VRITCCRGNGRDQFARGRPALLRPNRSFTSRRAKTRVRMPWLMRGRPLSSPLGRYEKAARPLCEYASFISNSRIAHLWLAASYAQLGQSAKARAAAPDVLHIEPNFTINRWKRTAVYRNPEDAERLYDGLR
jgi:hypothetical protein